MTKRLTLNEAYNITFQKALIPYGYDEYESPELKKLIEELKDLDRKRWDIVCDIRDMYLDQPILG